VQRHAVGRHDPALLCCPGYDCEGTLWGCLGLEIFWFLRWRRGRRVARGPTMVWVRVLPTVQWRRSGVDDPFDGSVTRPPHAGHLEPLDNGLGWAKCTHLWVGAHDDGYALGVGPGEFGAVEHEEEPALRVVIEEGMSGCVAPATQNDVVARPR
jgi:hypothetical protein